MLKDFWKTSPSHYEIRAKYAVLCATVSVKDCNRVAVERVIIFISSKAKATCHEDAWGRGGIPPTYS
jgi:hypothetical protein